MPKPNVARPFLNHFFNSARSQIGQPKPFFIMKNSFFILVSFAFFITSCTKDFVEPIDTELGKTELVSGRTGTTEVTLEVNSSEIIIDDFIVQFVDFDNDLGLVPSTSQTLKFIDNANENSPIFLSATVKGYEIIIDDFIVQFAVPGIDSDNLVLDSVQSLSFENE